MNQDLIALKPPFRRGLVIPFTVLAKSIGRVPHMSGVCLFLLIAAFGLTSVALSAEESPLFEWEDLPPLPDPVGVAAPFAGVHNGALIVGGGANFPEAAPWEGGDKIWHDEAWVLESPEAEWQTGFQLPRALAYGISITTEDGVLCIGGDDESDFYNDVFLLRWKDGELAVEEMPSLPGPCAYAAGAKLDGIVYMAGGLSEPEGEAEGALHTFWALDLAAEDPQWEELESWPGPERFLATAAAQDGAFYIAGGARLDRDGEQNRREFLTDAYRYTPGDGWERIADLPRPAVAAPSPAPTAGRNHFFILGGDDGSKIGFEPLSEDPGFPREVLAYHTITDTWFEAGQLPFPSVVTVPAVNWNDRLVLPSGEVRPGVRSPEIRSGKLRDRMAAFGVLNYSALALYLLALVGMAIYFSRQQTDTGEFFLGGRRIPWWAAGISIFGTQLSAITFIAIPAQVYANDWTFILANAAIVLIAPVVVFYYLPFFRRLNVTTAYEYLEQRFNLGTRLFGSAAFCLLQLGRMGIVLFIPAIVLSTATGIDLLLTILLMGGLATLYTVLGGIKAVIWTDVLQVFVLVGGAIIALFIISANVPGGVGGIFEMGAADNKFQTFNWTWDATVTAVWVVLLGNLFANLVPYSADQTVVQRYLTTASEKQAARSIWTNAVLTIPASLLFFFLGTALYVFYKTHPEMQEPGLQTDAVFPLFIAQALPAGIAGVVIAGVFAAAMSSLDSSMNSVATSLTTDFRRFRKEGRERGYLLLARILTLILGVFGTGAALLMAVYDVQHLWETYLKIIGLLGGSLAGLFALGVFTERANGPGALVGAVISVVTLYLVQAHTPLHFFLYAAIGILTCVIAGYLASFLFPTSPPPKGLSLHSINETPSANRIR